MSITPGTWKLEGNTVVGVRPDAPHLPLAVAQAFQIINYGDQRDRDMTIANARAIAEVPYLIKAVKGLLRHVKGDIGKAGIKACDDAEAVLARIEG